MDLSNSVHVKIEIPGQEEDVGTLLAWWWSTNETDLRRDDGHSIKWWSPENIKTIKSSSVIVFGVLLLWIIRWVKYPGHSHQVQEELMFFFLFFATWDLFYFMGSPLNLFPKDYFDHLLSWMNGWWLAWWWSRSAWTIHIIKDGGLCCSSSALEFIRFIISLSHSIDHNLLRLMVSRVLTHRNDLLVVLQIFANKLLSLSESTDRVLW